MNICVASLLSIIITITLWFTYVNVSLSYLNIIYHYHISLSFITIITIIYYYHISLSYLTIIYHYYYISLLYHKSTLDIIKLWLTTMAVHRWRRLSEESLVYVARLGASGCPGFKPAMVDVLGWENLGKMMGKCHYLVGGLEHFIFFHISIYWEQ